MLDAVFKRAFTVNNIVDLNLNFQASVSYSTPRCFAIGHGSVDTRYDASKSYAHAPPKSRTGPTQADRRNTRRQQRTLVTQVIPEILPAK